MIENERVNQSHEIVKDERKDWKQMICSEKWNSTGIVLVGRKGIPLLATDTFCKSIFTSCGVFFGKKKSKEALRGWYTSC
ncbi:MAG: hypothetical protein ACI9S8_000625 [Chlamydiales bacterium]|jgi:hypothetical protein